MVETIILSWQTINGFPVSVWNFFLSSAFFRAKMQNKNQLII